MNPLFLLNGYKQIIGLVILGVGSALKAAGFSDLGEPLVEVGGVLAGIGAAHKAVKGA